MKATKFNRVVVCPRTCKHRTTEFNTIACKIQQDWGDEFLKKTTRCEFYENITIHGELSQQIRDLFVKDGHFAGDNDELIELFIDSKKFTALVEKAVEMEKDKKLLEKEHEIVGKFLDVHDDLMKFLDDAKFIRTNAKKLLAAAEMFSVTLDEMSATDYMPTKSQENASNDLWTIARHFKPLDDKKEA